MKVRTIKDVDDETWKTFKEIATKRKIKMGVLLREIAREYKKKPSSSWNKILITKPIFTKKEAEVMLKTVTKIRKESGYRDVAVA